MIYFTDTKWFQVVMSNNRFGFKTHKYKKKKNNRFQGLILNNIASSIITHPKVGGNVFISPSTTRVVTESIRRCGELRTVHTLT